MDHLQQNSVAPDGPAIAAPPPDPHEGSLEKDLTDWTNDLVGRLADELSRVICEWQTAPDIATGFQFVTASHGTACAQLGSAGLIVPADALAAVLRHNSDTESEAHMRLWAWAQAKAIELTRRHRTSREPSYSSIARILKRYPKFQVWHTGGGCLAYQLDCDRGAYVLMTKCDDAQLPDMDAQAVSLGRYAANGEVVHESSREPVEKVEAWIEAALSDASDPKNVADYFARTLGAAHEDITLRNLPIDSTCGQDCIQAIDAASAFVSEVRSAFGDHHPSVGGHILTVARQIVSVYWRG